jgi:uncharacterized protein
MLPIRRDLHFRLEAEDVRAWHSRGPQTTLFGHALSLLFPEGERFFIQSVRHYRDSVTDPELKKAVTAFIGQEAMHGREHEDYNRLLHEIGLPAQRVERHLLAVLKFLHKHLPASIQLAVTIALEHFTAMLANLVLSDPRVIQGATPRMTALWRWHALEETEHKAVAYDVYLVGVGRGPFAYLLRTITMLITSVILWCTVFSVHTGLLLADKNPRTWAGWGAYFNFLFGSPGLLRRLALPWLDYFRPGFHPWDHDNSSYLAELKDLSGYAQNEGLRAA